jgi:DNA-binding response OmpR family regulator
VLAATAPRILLADSSPRMRRIVRVNLESAGCQVAECDCGDLQQQARRTHINALVINLDVRTSDVCAAVHVLRRRNPGVVIAGYSIWPADEVVRYLCIDMYVEKPFDLALFAARLCRVCTRATPTDGEAGLAR